MITSSLFALSHQRALKFYFIRIFFHNKRTWHCYSMYLIIFFILPAQFFSEFSFWPSNHLHVFLLLIFASMSLLFIQISLLYIFLPTPSISTQKHDRFSFSSPPNVKFWTLCKKKRKRKEKENDKKTKNTIQLFCVALA